MEKALHCWSFASISYRWNIFCQGCLDSISRFKSIVERIILKLELSHNPFFTIAHDHQYRYASGKSRSRSRHPLQRACFMARSEKIYILGEITLQLKIQALKASCVYKDKEITFYKL